MRDDDARRAAIVVGLFAVLFGVRFVLDDPTYIGATFLLVLPTMLAALWFGVRGGVGVALAAAVAFFVAERLDPSEDAAMNTLVSSNPLTRSDPSLDRTPHSIGPRSSVVSPAIRSRSSRRPGSAWAIRRRATSSAREIQDRRARRNGTSSATGRPFCVMVTCSPDCTRRSTPAVSLRRSRDATDSGMRQL